MWQSVKRQENFGLNEDSCKKKKKAVSIKTSLRNALFTRKVGQPQSPLVELDFVNLSLGHLCLDGILIRRNIDKKNIPEFYLDMFYASLPKVEDMLCESHAYRS